MLNKCYLIFEDEDSVMLSLLVDELEEHFPVSRYDISREKGGTWGIYALVNPNSPQYLDAIRCAAVVASNIYKRAVSSAISQEKVKGLLA